jgi:hypothetical protein
MAIQLLIRLPPYMCDLNTTELAWAKIKRTTHENCQEIWGCKNYNFTKDAVALMTKEDWEGFCTHRDTVENQYWRSYGIIPKVMDRTVINLNPGCHSEWMRTVMPTLKVTVTVVKLTSTIILCLVKTVIWSLHSHYRVKQWMFLFAPLN